MRPTFLRQDARSRLRRSPDSNLFFIKASFLFMAAGWTLTAQVVHRVGGCVEEYNKEEENIYSVYGVYFSLKEATVFVQPEVPIDANGHSHSSGLLM